MTKSRIGDTAELRRLCTADDLFVFANSSGNHNPMHLPHRDGDGDGQAGGGGARRCGSVR
jgi:hypothetical protein